MNKLVKSKALGSLALLLALFITSCDTQQTKFQIATIAAKVIKLQMGESVSYKLAVSYAGSDPVVYLAENGDPDAAVVSVKGDIVTIIGTGVGVAHITVAAALASEVIRESASANDNQLVLTVCSGLARC